LESKITKKKKILFFSGNRAEYSLILPVVKELEQYRDINCSMILSGNHLEKKFGETINEVLADNIKNIIKLDISNNYKQPANMAISISIVIKKLTGVIQKIKPDILVVYGDRFETLGATVAGHENNIIVAHIEGGDITHGGTHDDNIRHAITKLSHLHFTTNIFSYRRVVALGEQRWRVKLAGFTAIDLIKRKDFTCNNKIISKYNLAKDKPLLLLTMHPLSFSLRDTKKEIDATLNGIQKLFKVFKVDCIITYPNNDAGSQYIIKKIKNFKSNNKNIFLTKSLGRKDYWGVMNLIKSKFKVICIGNSSSGIKESAAFSCPTINVGNRQKGRVAPKNIIHCPADSKIIFNKITKILKNDDFYKKCKKINNPYGKGNAGKKIASYLANLKIDQSIIIKKTHI